MMLILYGATVLYIVFSGLWGVVVTDVLQFVIAMVGCVVLAIASVGKVGGLEALWAKAAANLPSGATEIYPWFFSGPVYVVVIWLGVQWWASWYPGFEPGGGGYVVQRLLSTKDERHAVGAALIFNVLHFVVRPWPWIITALAAAAALPYGADRELLYPQAIQAWLPPGLRGLLIAAFLAAFMSTIATHLNWGASYLVGDLVRGTRFGGGTAATLLISRAAIVALALGAIGVSQLMTSVSQGWELILMLSAGTGPVYLLRWHWSRVNAWSEITAMSASLFYSLALARFTLPQELRLCWVAVLTTATWVTVTFITSRKNANERNAFLDEINAAAWRLRDFVLFLAGVAVIYAAFFAVGEILKRNFFAAALNGLVVFTAAAVAFAVLRRKN